MAKITCLFFLLSLFFYRQADAQAMWLVLIFGDKAATEQFHFSIDAGLNVSSLNGYEDGGAKLGINYGVGAHLKLSDRWSLVSEFKPFSTKGANNVENPIKLPEDAVNSEVKSNVNLNYLEIPVLGQYWLNDGLYFSAGSQISFLLWASQKTSIVLPNGTEVDVKQDLKDSFRGIDFGIPLEAGYKFILNEEKNKQLDVRLRYTFGLSEVFEANTGLSARTSTFQLMLTLPFLKKSELDAGQAKTTKPR